MRRKSLAQIRVRTRPGDRTRGKAVFAKTCAACHQLDGVGAAVGPDLAMVANKTPRYLLAKLLEHLTEKSEPEAIKERND